MRRGSPVFLLSIGLALVWLVISTCLAIPWLQCLTGKLPKLYLVPVIIGIALLPGYLSNSMFLSNLLNSRPLPTSFDYAQAVTVLICARNEQANIYQSIARLVRQTYPGRLRILCVDNGSTDRTRTEILRAMRQLQTEQREIQFALCSRPGKSYALNTGLSRIDTQYFITVDADTFLEPDAVRQIISYISTYHAGCVAGNLLVAHPNTWVQKMQLYDYLISIAAVKRFQGAYRATLVAQGAFSAYETQLVKRAGGWPADVGEDIVLTYRLLQFGRSSLYDPHAIGYTVVPATLRAFFRQRVRWARGMFDGLHAVLPWEQPSFFDGYFETLNLSVILVDLAYVFGFLVGVVLLLFGLDWFVGWLTLLTLPGVVAESVSVYLFQKRLPVRIENSFLGLLCFVLLFQTFQSACSLYGYAQFLLHRRTAWK